MQNWVTWLLKSTPLVTLLCRPRSLWHILRWPAPRTAGTVRPIARPDAPHARLTEAASLADSTYTKHAPAEDILTGGPPIAPIPTEFQVHSEGLYQGLPVYDESFHGKSALVAGANGVSVGVFG
jgi:hypothetical protein